MTKTEWLVNNPQNIIAGIVVSLAIIPEAIGFSIIAGVNPMTGLYTSLIFAFIISLFGGRPGMISAATSAMALVIVSLVKNYGINYLFAATILTGIIQYLFGIFKISKIMRFIPRTVMIGFVNSLAIMIFLAQIPHITQGSWLTYVLILATLIILYILPKFTLKMPAPLFAIVSLTTVAVFFKLDLKTIGDLGSLNGKLPSFSIPIIPMTLESFKIILPYAFSLSVVGLLESMLTARIIDDMTDTESDKNQEAKGQGLANILTGFFGGMGGCAMLGQSMVNMKSGGRTRLSSLTVGIFLLISILFLTDIIMKIPIAVLVGIMVMISIDTFDWASLSYLKKMPISDSIVMVLTVIVVILTHDLFKGVAVGVVLSSLFFVIKISEVNVTQQLIGSHLIATIKGELFFASVENFIQQFDFNANYDGITLDFKKAHVWDDSAVGAIDKIVLKYRDKGCHVNVENLNTESKQLVDSIGLYQNTDAKINLH